MDNYCSSRALIVGGLGFVGSRLAAAFSERTRMLVTYRSLSMDRKQWLQRHIERIVWLHYDSATQKKLPVDGVFKFILNLATPSAMEAVNHPEASLERALRTVRACQKLVNNGQAARLIHFSSFHVYGAHSRLRFSEEDIPHPTYPYGEIHWKCEQTIMKATNRAPIFIIRPTNIVGAPAHGDLGMQRELIFLDLCRQTVQDHEIRLRSDGRGYRDFVPITDVIRAIELLVTQASNLGPCVQVLNLSSGRALRLDSLAYEIQKEAQDFLGCKVSVTLGNSSDLFPEPFHVTNDRLRSLGWKPQGSFRDEIRQTLTFFKSLT